jgi:hypothetical protein
MVKKKPYIGHKKLDENLIYKMAKKWCTTQEIADICECSPDTIERNFMHLLKKARAEGKESLRTAQWKSALEDGSVAMQIWLGKQKLDQKEPAKEEAPEQVIEEIKFTVHPSMVPDAPRTEV